MHFGCQLLEKLLHHAVAFCGDGLRRGGVQAVFQLAQFEQVLVVGAVRLAGKGLTAWTGIAATARRRAGYRG